MEFLLATPQKTSQQLGNNHDCCCQPSTVEERNSMIGNINAVLKASVFEHRNEVKGGNGLYRWCKMASNFEVPSVIELGMDYFTGPFNRRPYQWCGYSARCPRTSCIVIYCGGSLQRQAASSYTRQSDKPKR